MAVLGSTSLTGCSSIPSFIAAGSLMLFQQTSAPTGWTKQTTHNNKALRVVTGTATPGGSTAFTSVFASRPVTGSVGNHTLTTPQIPSHTHNAGSGSPVQDIEISPGPQPFGEGPIYEVFPARTSANTLGPATGPAGSGGAHNHPFSGTAMNFAVQYVDLIICAKA